MTQIQMKSDILHESSSRSDSRQCLQRRRLSKAATATINGEYDPDLALAIQESLKQAELDAIRTKEREQMPKFDSNPNALKENRPNNMAKSPSTQEMLNETKRLKDLVNVHLDLIQQQQDVINKKDNTIKTLKADNSALQCRLQRMERRMCLLKQKEDVADTHTVQSSPPQPGTLSFTQPIATPPHERHAHSVRSKRLEPQSLSKRLNRADSHRASPIKSEPAVGSKSTKRYLYRKRKLSSHVEEPEIDGGELKTNKLYYVSYYEPISDQIETESRLDIVKGAQSQLNIEVPTWRIKTYSNLYVIEGTEDHEDETFIRRHQKPEIEEKRRKRWDNQRQRDETMCEKQKEREKRTYWRKKNEPVETFYQRLDDITHIEVQDKIPVSAFGQSIPYMNAGEFGLPWEPKRSTSHRVRQK